MFFHLLSAFSLVAAALSVCLAFFPNNFLISFNVFEHNLQYGLVTKGVNATIWNNNFIDNNYNNNPEIFSQANVDGNDFAATKCNEYGNSWRGWYLPSSYELLLMAGLKDFIGGFEPAMYWSSTEEGLSHAMAVDFNLPGSLGMESKDALHYFRCIKSF